MNPITNVTDANLARLPLPQPRCTMNVRQAVTGDIGFIDQLQKMHSHMVGWFPTKQLEANIAGGNIVIAETADKVPLGYCIAKDQYMKRDDVGIVYQLNVLPLKQRNLIGATLIKAVFERAAYGCRLFCCWCAQDIQANYFWESIGFVPLAFRTGSRAKQRIHIFWQKRIREGDEGSGGTPYWFPAQTSGGAVSEDRIVLPIPPGTHWRDAKPVLLPGQGSGIGDQGLVKKDEVRKLPGGRPEQPKLSKLEKTVIMRSQSVHLGGVPMGRKAVIRGGRIRYVERDDFVPELDAPPELDDKPKKVKKERKPRQKHDKEFVAKARELRDKFLEQVNGGLLLPPSCAKYEVSRQLGAARADTSRPEAATSGLLEAA